MLISNIFHQIVLTNQRPKWPYLKTSHYQISPLNKWNTRKIAKVSSRSDQSLDKRLKMSHSIRGSSYLVAILVNLSLPSWVSTLVEQQTKNIATKLNQILTSHVRLEEENVLANQQCCWLYRMTNHYQITNTPMIIASQGTFLPKLWSIIFNKRSKMFQAILDDLTRNISSKYD